MIFRVDWYRPHIFHKVDNQKYEYIEAVQNGRHFADDIAKLFFFFHETVKFLFNCNFSKRFAQWFG